MRKKSTFGRSFDNLNFSYVANVKSHHICLKWYSVWYKFLHEHFQVREANDTSSYFSASG